ncbi:MAG TPA: hypothetical protein VGA61_01990, partial [Anaerolineae bacterium]
MNPRDAQRLPPGAGPSGREPASSRPAAGLAARAAAALAALRARFPPFGPHASTGDPVRPAGVRWAPPQGNPEAMGPDLGMRPPGQGGKGGPVPRFTIPLTQETAGLALALFGLVLAGWLVLGWLVGGSTAMFLWILFGW